MSYVGFIYRWTNTLNGMMYIGSHLGNIDDGYIGSGIRFLNAVHKYGIENFDRDIIEYCYEPMGILVTEQKYLDQFDCARSKKYYNISPTAGGGNCGNGKKISATKLARKHPSWLKGKKQYQSVIDQLSDVWEVTFPNGDVTVAKNMANFCREHGLNPSAMSGIARGKRRHYKGYRCRKLSNNRNVEYEYKEWKSKGHAAKANYGSKNGFSKPVIVNRVTYSSMREASEATGMSMFKLRKVMKRNNNEQLAV